MADDEAFKRRVLEQDWRQGALIPWKGELAHQIAALGVRNCDLRADPGVPVLPGEEPEGHFMLISQLCDLTAPAVNEPFAVALPAGLYDPDPARQLPGRNSARWLLLDPVARTVASQARAIIFPKELLPDEAAQHPPIIPETLSTWCARRWRRMPLPDEFTGTIQRALEDALKQVANDRALGATLCWRVEFLLPDDDGAPEARLLAVYDPESIDAAAFANYVAEVTERLRARRERYDRRFAEDVPGHRPYYLEPSQPTPVSQLAVQTAIDCPMISFDHLSPDPDGEPEGAQTPELPEEQIF